MINSSLVILISFPPASSPEARRARGERIALTLFASVAESSAAFLLANKEEAAELACG